MQFKAQCKDRVFTLDLVSDDELQTIFCVFEMKDGVSNKKLLTEREKLIKTLESHMNI